MTTTADGRYILRPDGGAWRYVEIASGRVVRATEESNGASHAAARDSLAFLAGLDLDSLSEADDPDAVLAIAMPEADPQLVEVLRVE